MTACVSVALASVLLLAGCGGSLKQPWEDATPCLRPLATFFDHGRPLSLPYRNPFGPAPTQMASPKAFQRELELSYPAGRQGANAVDFLFFAEPEDAQRVLRRIKATPNFFPTAELETVGAAIVRWSSRPTDGQRKAIAACIGD